MNTVDKIKAAWRARQIFNTFEKEHKRMGDYDFKKTLAKAAKDFLVTAFAVASVAVGGALGEYFSKGENIEAAFAALPAPLIAVLVPLVSAGAVALSNWAKHRKNAEKVVPVLLLLLLPAFASAQDAPKPKSEAALSCGAMRFVERGSPDSEDFVCRLSLAVPAPSGLTLFARADYSRTQSVPAGEELSLDIKTFRSIEGFAGARKDIAPNLSATAFAGVTWNRDRTIEPTDPRLWTVAGGLRYTLPGRGNVVAAAGHHGPVGGTAFLGSVTYELGDNAAWFGDVAVPLGATRFQAKPYTVRFGVSARIRGWKF